MKGTGESAPGSSAILTVPNLLSGIRIALIPVFVYLIVHESTTAAGIILFGVVVATDWVDGYIARRTGQVSELGKILDPVADRLAILAGLVALVIRDAFPLWAALLIVVRDVAVLIVGALLLAGRHIRIDVRAVGKAATFSLMTAIPWIAWGTLGYVLHVVLLPAGWLLYAFGIVAYYAAAALYVGDIRRATSTE
jgi:cardiolipin synthase (CMP-forming)